MTDTAHPPDINDPALAQFVAEVATALQSGERHQTAGFGTFTTCTRKVTPDRPACTIAMFRPDKHLRTFVNGGPAPDVSGPHADILARLARALSNNADITIPDFGRLAALPVTNKPPKLIFHGAKVLTDSLNT